MSTQRFFDLLHSLFDAMNARRYFFRDMQEIIRYENSMPDAHMLVVPNDKINLGLLLLIATCEQADVRIRAEYLKVVEVLFSHVEDYAAAMEFAFSLPFFCRHNRLDSHKLADDYDHFADQVHNLMDWIFDDEFDREVAVRSIGFLAIIHPLYVLRDVVKAAIRRLNTPKMERLFWLCDRFPVLFRLRVPNPRREDSDTTEAAFMCVLRRFLVFEKPYLNMDVEEDRVQFGRVMLVFVRNRFRVTGTNSIARTFCFIKGTVMLEKRSYFDPLDFVFNFIIDYLSKNHYVEFFLCLLEEIFITADEDGNAVSDKRPVGDGKTERVIYRTQFPMFIDGQDDISSMDVLFFMRILIDMYIGKPARYRPRLHNIFYLLAARIDYEYGSGFFDEAMPLKCQWIIDSLPTTGDGSLRLSIADWFPGLFARAAGSTRSFDRYDDDEINSLNESGVKPRFS